MVLTTRELIDKTGATPRQIDFWVACEILNPIGQRYPGRGNHRQFNEDVVPAVKLLVNISNALYRTVPVSELKRLYENYRRGYLELAPGIILTWEVENEDKRDSL